MSFTWWWYPKRRFTIDGHPFVVKMTARTDGLHSALELRNVTMASDATPLFGPEAVRNHRLGTIFPDGRQLDVEAGYIGIWTTGIIARVNGAVVHESHPGRTPQFPEAYRQATIDMAPGRGGIKSACAEGATARGEDWSVWQRNKLPIAVDIVTGLLFFIVAKLTDLTTAALLGAAVGVGLLVFQRITRIDVTGGLALFGIAMLLISATLAIIFADDETIKQRGTITGLIAAGLFLTDGLFGGRRLASGLARYLPYNDLDVARLGIGMGTAGVAMAAINFAVASLATTDMWLFYSTFVDFVVFIILFQFVLRYARGAPRL
jgi:intracellular septation protein A